MCVTRVSVCVLLLLANENGYALKRVSNDTTVLIIVGLFRGVDALPAAIALVVSHLSPFLRVKKEYQSRRNMRNVSLNLFKFPQNDWNRSEVSVRRFTMGDEREREAENLAKQPVRDSNTHFFHNLTLNVNHCTCNRMFVKGTCELVAQPYI